jgi:nucleolar MIF4G domain-containing protein 1
MLISKVGATCTPLLLCLAHSLSLSLSFSLSSTGRWWVVGSAWTGRESTATAASSSACQSVTAESWVLELARNQRMNTDVRRNIFCVLVTSEDCVDAFEKLLRLGLKDKQEREIVHILVDCCLQERQFNPYYAFLGQKFCECSRTHQVYCIQLDILILLGFAGIMYI